MFRKEPQAAEEWSVNHTLSCGERQKNILDDAYKMLKNGGYIMYSTCTFSYDENEAVVIYMAEKYGMEICPLSELDMLCDGIGEYPDISNCRRIFPHKQNGEGHFTALLRKTEETNVEKPVNKKDKRKEKSDTALENAVKLFREFEKKTLNIKCDGEFILFGDNLYLLPEKIDVSKLRVLRCGLHLGIIKKGRFEPSHALSHAFGSECYINKAKFDCNSDEIKKYLHGETVTSDMNGWGIVCADVYPLGWGKSSGGIVKNHYPKALRTL
jgi:NOL1/NOP2/fmu family ribosome biogenesis protein